MRRHMAKEHPFQTYTKLESASQWYVDGPQNRVQSATGKCQLCYKTLGYNEIDRHLCIVHKPNILCNYCSMTFETTNGLLNHIGVHSAALKIDRKRKSYECQQCSIAYVMRILLDCHKMAHILGHAIDDTSIDKHIESVIIIKPDESQNDGNGIATKSSVSGAMKSLTDSAQPVVLSSRSAKNVRQKCK